MCIAGWLGGLEPVKDFDLLMQMKSDVLLSLFGTPRVPCLGCTPG